MEYMSDTLFISGKKKRTASVNDIFEKVAKGIKKKGPTRNWVCKLDEENSVIVIDFNDEKSETFILNFGEKNEFSCICKLYWPIDETIDPSDCENLKTLLDLIYRAKSKFNSISVTDDYGLAEGYWESKKYKFEFRDLTDDEVKRVESLFNKGFTKHEDLLRAIMAEDMKMDYADIIGYENPEVALGWESVGSINNTLLSYIYETSAYGNEGDVSTMSKFFGDPNKCSMALMAFSEGVGWAFCDGTRSDFDAQMDPESAREITIRKHRCVSPTDAQVDLMFTDMFARQFIDENDPLKRCILAYRYFVSVYDFCGFKFTEHHKRQFYSDRIIEEYGEEIGKRYMTVRVTRRWYDHASFQDDELFHRNVEKRYGSDFFTLYDIIEEKYGKYIRFFQETEYYAIGSGKYLDKTLTYVCS